jgi:hypothetical protein
MRLVSVAVLLAAVTACAGSATDPASGDSAISADPAKVRPQDNGAKASPTQGLLIDHHGPVLASSKTFAIYWGTQKDFPSDLKGAMATLLDGFDGSSYLGIAQQYMRGAQISSQYLGSLDDADPANPPPSHSPKTSTIGAEVCHLIGTPDANTIYVVFTSNAPHVNYCAWHDKATCDGVNYFQVAYVPNQALLPGCSPYTRTNLHCNGYSDGTVSSADSVAHEFMEAVTDPHIDAWLDANGQEVADKCNFNYQACVTLGKPGSTSSWQIQSEWSNALLPTPGCQQQ